jgi:hypothetical protein
MPIYSGGGIFNWHYLSSPPQILRCPVVHLESKGLMCTSVPLIQVAPPGYFVHVSVTTPVVSALKNYYM